MKPENIEKWIKDTDVDTNAGMDKVVLDDVLKALEQSKEQKTAKLGPNIWRIIMKSRITKLATAAVIIIAVLVAINHFGGSIDGASVAWGGVLEIMEKIPTVVYDMTTTTTFGENKTMPAISEVYDGGGYGVRADTYMNGELFMQKFFLPKEKVTYTIMPRERVYFRYVLSKSQAATEGDTPRKWVKTILSEDYTELGQGNINGIDVEGVEVQNSELLGSDEGVVRLWVDVETNLPVRMELEGMMNEGGVKRPMKFVMNNFQWNIVLNAGIFDPNIPEDYTQREQQKVPDTKVPEKSLSDDEKNEQASVKETVVTLFQAIANENWSEVSNIWPSLVLNERRKTRIRSVEIVSIEEPFKRNDSSDWIVPYYIKVESGEIDDKTLQVRYDETAMRFIVCGGS